MFSEARCAHKAVEAKRVDAVRLGCDELPTPRERRRQSLPSQPNPYETMLHVGLTGSIGSGKSTAAKAFEELGIPVYYADDAAKRLMTESATLREAIEA